jgi:hypothetical protein
MISSISLPVGVLDKATLFEFIEAFLRKDATRESERNWICSYPDRTQASL